MPSHIRVKICGLRDPSEARVAVKAGADMLGVVLCTARRQVSLSEAAEILAEAPSTVGKVGIFVDPDIEEVEAAVEIAGIEIAQLCGAESPEFCSHLDIEVMKSFRMVNRRVVPDPFAYPGRIRHFDSPNVHGGSGIEWDWGSAAALAGEVDVLLAGGLDQQNVAKAVQVVLPWGVDVSSGVESAGTKDTGKIYRFVEVAKS